MPQQYTLKLNFDLRQVTQTLAYEFVLGQGGSQDYPMKDDGPLAGTFHFQPGDEIFVEVIATAPVGDGEAVMQDFKVSNCTFISVPAHMNEFLSLFNETSACAVMDDEGWGAVNPLPGVDSTSRRFSISNDKPLPVVTKNGQWKISGYLSVQLPPLGNVPIREGVRNQLYFFDPEGSTGKGGGFGP